MSENNKSVAQARPIPQMAVPFVIDYDFMSPPPTPPEMLTPPLSPYDEDTESDEDGPGDGYADRDEGEGSAKKRLKLDKDDSDGEVMVGNGIVVEDGNGVKGNPGVNDHHEL